MKIKFKIYSKNLEASLKKKMTLSIHYKWLTPSSSKVNHKKLIRIEI